MPQRPETGGLRGPLAFKAGLHARTVPGQAVYVFSEHRVTALRGRHVEALAPLLDGTRDLAALQRAAPAGLAPDRVAELVARLDRAGLIGPAPQAPPERAAFWEAGGADPAAAERSVSGTAVQPVALGTARTEETASALADTGLGVRAPVRHAPGAPLGLAPDADLTVVLCTDYLAPGLEEVDAAHRRNGRPWLLARPTGAVMWIGPLFTPLEGGGCWHCLAHRLRFHRQGELHALEAVGGAAEVDRPGAAVPALTAAGAGLVATEAAKWAAGHRGPWQRSVWTMDTVTLEARLHPLHARPQCPACGDPSLVRAQAHRAVRPRPRPRDAQEGTGHRSLSSRDVLDTYAHLISPVTGLVKELTPVEGPPGFHTYRSGPNAAAPGTGPDGLRAVLRVENGGKGTTDEQARASALCEALERRSGTYHGDEERIRGSYTELADTAVHPADCLLYDPRQYAERERWNAEHGAFQFVCAPFDEDAATDWTPLWSLTEERRRLLPTAMLYFAAPPEPGEPAVVADSNGCAAGALLEDAVLQGALEVVERDAVALWWYNRTPCPGVDLDAFADPWVERMRRVYPGLGREFWVLDVTSDLGVPAMAAVTRRTDGGPEEVMFGFGAHLDAGVALRRAVAEMNQLLAATARSADWGDPDADRWLRGPGTAAGAYLLPDPDRKPSVPGGHPPAAGADAAADVLELRDRFAARGLDMLVLDQTRPDIGLPVAKVVVPGMRGMWARLAPGRLFDVPVELGRLSAPTDYADLNPYPLFL